MTRKLRLPPWMKNANHGNFHFHSGDVIELKKQGNLLLRLRDLEFVSYLLALPSRREGKDENYYWQKFNSDLQKVIDDTVSRLEPGSDEGPRKEIK